MYFLYSFLYGVSLLFILPVEYFKRPREIRRRWLREKLGLFDSYANVPPSPVIWIHAVSVGEVMAALPLLRRLRTAYPAHGLILSTVTDTGQKVAQEGSPEGTKIVYLPFDIPPILKSVITRMRLRLLIIVETELWPNLLRVSKSSRVPVILLNGRISERSFRGYRKIACFMRHVLSSIDTFGMQNEEYAARLISLGVDRGKIQISGSFKFDADPQHQTPSWTSTVGKPVIVAGSTHEGEEELLASVYAELSKDFTGLNLIIAPRHPERFARVEEMLRTRRMPFVKRSAFRDVQQMAPFHGKIILLDSVGELQSVYGIATIAVIGKSFSGHGGQNPLEPAYWGVPVVCGPHMENFPVIREFYDAGAAVAVKGDDLSSALRELLSAPEKAQAIGLNAQRLYQKNAGSVEKALKIIRHYTDVS